MMRPGELYTEARPNFSSQNEPHPIGRIAPKVMTTLPVPHPASPQVVDGLLRQLLEQARYLDSGEILQFLTAFQKQLDDEIHQIEEFTDRRGQLLAEIPVCCDYARLGALHRELNELEMEEFLKVQSVFTLHHNCTEYRDLLS